MQHRQYCINKSYLLSLFISIYSLLLEQAILRQVDKCTSSISSTLKSSQNSYSFTIIYLPAYSIPNVIQLLGKYLVIVTITRLVTESGSLFIMYITMHISTTIVLIQCRYPTCTGGINIPCNLVSNPIHTY